MHNWAAGPIQVLNLNRTRGEHVAPLGASLRCHIRPCGTLTSLLPKGGRAAPLGAVYSRPITN
jgi:hypothetical protein